MKLEWNTNIDKYRIAANKKRKNVMYASKKLLNGVSNMEYGVWNRLGNSKNFIKLKFIMFKMDMISVM